MAMWRQLFASLLLWNPSKLELLVSPSSHITKFTLNLLKYVAHLSSLRNQRSQHLTSIISSLTTRLTLFIMLNCYGKLTQCLLRIGQHIKLYPFAGTEIFLMLVRESTWYQRHLHIWSSKFLGSQQILLHNYIFFSVEKSSFIINWLRIIFVVTCTVILSLIIIFAHNCVLGTVFRY